MCSNKKGFLLIDTLICIVVLMAIVRVTYVSVTYRYSHEEHLHHKRDFDDDYINHSNFTIVCPTKEEIINEDLS